VVADGATVVGNWGGGAIWRVTSGVFPSNAYFCAADVPGGGVLIDPGLDAFAIDAALSAHGLRPHQVFCTHGHFDHIGGAAHFQGEYGCEVFLHERDARTMKASNFLLMALRIPARVTLPEVTFVGDDTCIDVGGQPMRFRPAPGHTPGSSVLEFGTAWFTGDTLYRRGVGLSQLPGEDRGTLRETVLGLWPELTEQRMVYPGHGGRADGSTIRAENDALVTFLGLVAR
jgi:hydroxyacylglutathione hydrolase